MYAHVYAYDIINVYAHVHVKQGHVHIEINKHKIWKC
jgi:hypothetical protein